MEFSRKEGVLGIRGLQAALIDAAIALDNAVTSTRSETAMPDTHASRLNDLLEAARVAEIKLRDGGTYPIKGETWRALRDALLPYKGLASLGVSATRRVEPDNVGDTDRWQDPRDLSGGQTDATRAKPDQTKPIEDIDEALAAIPTKAEIDEFFFNGTPPRWVHFGLEYRYKVKKLAEAGLTASATRRDVMLEAAAICEDLGCKWPADEKITGTQAAAMALAAGRCAGAIRIAANFPGEQPRYVHSSPVKS